MNQAQQPEALRLAARLREGYSNLRSDLEPSAAELERLHARVQELEAISSAERQKRQEAELMAECMGMVRQDLIDAGMIDKSVPPMMVSDAVIRHIQSNGRNLEGQQQRDPLTDEKLAEALQIGGVETQYHTDIFKREKWTTCGSMDPRKIARAIERAHGITEPIGRLHEALISLHSPECWCETCDIAANHGLRSRMSLCPQCGNKRCPRASSHSNACTASNALGQKGFSWEDVKPASEEIERDHSDEDAAIAAGKVQAAVQGRVG